MIDSDGYAELVACRPVLFHYVWNADVATLDSIVANGLERQWSRYDGFWRSRPGHVYLGELDALRRIFAADENECQYPYALLSIATAWLEPQKINPDEDHFLTSMFPEASRNKVGERHACQHFGHEFPPTEWMWEWAEYLKCWRLPSLGEWADAVGLGKHPDEARYSMSKGTLAYDGVIPPRALRLIDRGFA